MQRKNGWMRRMPGWWPWSRGRAWCLMVPHWALAFVTLKIKTNNFGHNRLSFSALICPKNPKMTSFAGWGSIALTSVCCLIRGIVFYCSLVYEWKSMGEMMRSCPHEISAFIMMISSCTPSDLSFHFLDNLFSLFVFCIIFKSLQKTVRHFQVYWSSTFAIVVYFSL